MRKLNKFSCLVSCGSYVLDFKSLQRGYAGDHTPSIGIYAMLIQNYG